VRRSFKKINLCGIILALIIAANITGCSFSKKKSNQVVIAGYGIESDVQLFINLCRKAHPEIEIEVKDYKDYGQTADALKQLKLDINAKKCGDIFISSKYFSTDYSKFGIFQNLNEIQGFDEIKSKMLPNILKSVETDGNIYSVYPFFTLNCHAAKKSNVMPEQWSRKGILDILDSAVDNDINFFGNNSDTKIQNIIISEICHDYDNGASLDKEWYSEFIDTGRQLAKIEKTSDVDYSDELIFKNNEVICSEVTIDSFDKYYYIKKACFDDDITLLGSAYDENTIAINAELMMSILSDSSNKEGAWTVLSYFMSDEFQEIIAKSDSFPVFKDSFETMYDNALQEYYIDENGNKTEKKDGIYVINGMEVKFDLPTEKDLKEIYDILTSADQIQKQNYNLRKELMDLIGKSFDSDKKSEQIIDELDNAYQLYMSETQ